MLPDLQRFPTANPALAYDLAKNQLTIQLSSIDSTDDKLALMISLSTGLIAILLGFFGIRSAQVDPDISRWSIGLASGAAGFYLGTLICLALAVRTRGWNTGATAREAWSLADQYSGHETILGWWAVESFVVSLETNEAFYREKRLLANGGLALLLGQTALGIASLAANLA